MLLLWCLVGKAGVRNSGNSHTINTFSVGEVEGVVIESNDSPLMSAPFFYDHEPKA